MAVFLGLMTVMCLSLVVAMPFAARWPAVFQKTHFTIWEMLVFALLGYTCARTAAHLWRLQRIGGVVALGLFASSLLASYIGLLKGGQSVSLDAIPLILIAFGWRELK